MDGWKCRLCDWVSTLLEILVRTDGVNIIRLHHWVSTLLEILEVRLKSPVATDIPRGVKPVGKAARKALTYTPLKPRKKSTEEVTSAPAPKIEEVTSAVSPPPTAHGKKGKGKNGKKAVATAV